MSVIFDGSSVKYATLPNTSYFNNTVNFTYAVWFKPAGGATRQFVFGLDQNTGPNGRFSGTVFRGDAANAVAFTKSSVTTDYGVGTAGVDAWNLHIVGRPSGGPAQSTKQALNATDVTNSTQLGADYDLMRLILGARKSPGSSTTYNELYNGKVGAWAIWNRVLSDAEIDTLQGGARPETIASGLVDWMEILGSGTATTLATNGVGTTMTFGGSPALDSDTPFDPAINPTGTDTDLVNGASSNIVFQNLTSNPVSVAVIYDDGVASAISSTQADFVLGTVTDGAATATFTNTIGNLPYSDGATYFASSYSYLVTCEDDSELTLDTLTFAPATGRDFVVAVDPVSDATGILYQWEEGGPVTGDQVDYQTDAVTVREDFTFFGPAGESGVTLNINYWDSVGQIRYAVSVIVAFDESGEGTVTGFAERGFTAEGFTVRGFTTRGF